MRKGKTRADYVPAAPIRRALREWLVENGLGDGMGNGFSKERYHSPFTILADRTGMTEGTLFRHSKGDRGYESMQFDVADRILAATNRQNWWHCEPQLSGVYEQACKGADAIYPIAEEEPEPLFAVCQRCEVTFEPNNRHGGRQPRFCSQACRQAAYKERKVAV